MNNKSMVSKRYCIMDSENKMVETFETLPEARRKLYTEYRSGQHYLKTEPKIAADAGGG